MLHWGWNCLAILKETLPKRRFLITFESVFAAYVCVAYVLSMLLIILRKDWVWIANKRQSRKIWLFVDSTSRPQEERGFTESWNLCFNICSRKWVRHRQGLVTNLYPMNYDSSGFVWWSLKFLFWKQKNRYYRQSWDPICSTR